MQHCCRGRLIIRGVKDDRPVEWSHCPVQIGDLDAQFLRTRSECIGPFARVLDVLDTLLGELDRRDERGRGKAPVIERTLESTRHCTLRWLVVGRECRIQ